MNRFQMATKNTINGLVDKLILIIFPFVVRTAIIRYLGIQYVGLNGLFTSIFTVLNLSELGIGNAIVYQMYKPYAEGDINEINELLNVYRKAYRYIGLAICIIGVVLLPVLKIIIKGSIPDDVNIYYLYLTYLLNTCLSYWLYSYKISLLNASQNTRAKNNIDLIVLSLQYLVQIIIIVLSRNYNMFIGVLPVFTVVNNLAIALYTQKKYPIYKPIGSVSYRIKQNIKSNVFSLVGHKIGAVIITSADSIVISAFLGLVVLGKYNNYYYVMYTVITILSIVYFSLLPSVGNSIAVRDKGNNLKLFYAVSFCNSCLVGWCSVCLICLYQDFIILWVGADNVLNGIIVILFAIDFYVWKIFDNVALFKDAAGIWKQDYIRPYVASAINLVLNILLVNVIGLKGVLLSTILSIVIINIPWSTKALFDSYFGDNPQQYYIKQIYQLIATIIAVVASYYACSMFKEVLWINLIIKMFVCTILTAVIYLLMFNKTEECKYCIKKLKNYVKRF